MDRRSEFPGEGHEERATDWHWSHSHHRSHRFPHRKPRWWPADEPWPPVGPPSHLVRGRFFRRVGRLFILFNLLVVILIALAISFAVKISTILSLPNEVLVGLFPIGIIAFAIVATLLVWVGRSLHSTSTPIDDLLEAAERVATGDYSARVREAGPNEIRALVRSFNEMASRLEQTDAQRRSVMADVTHELRTPLSVIQGNLEGILDGVYPADDATLKSILDETHMLSRLIDDLRTLALAESGALQLTREQTDLASLVSETVAAFRAQADAGSVALKADVPPDPVLSFIDPARVREVLANLITNALRHTPRNGSVCIRLTLGETISVRQSEISIEDNGSGIAPGDLPHVFDRFYKRDSSGMGLGLSIARKLVEAHGGEIAAESKAGEGTKIRFTLPLQS
jgi:signal transduction histidine kinase